MDGLSSTKRTVYRFLFILAAGLELGSGQAGSPSYIHITEPSTGAVWFTGATHLIRWDTDAYDNYHIAIDLYQGGFPVQSIVADYEIMTVHEYPWTLPGSLPHGSDYSIKITVLDSIGVFTVSELFTITTSPPELVNLFVSGFSAPAVVDVDQSIGDSLNLEVGNSGSSRARFFSIGLFLSPDSLITVSDQLLDNGHVFVDSIAPDTIQNITVPGNVSVPGNITPGYYYVGAVVDEFMVIPETDENDNTASLMIAVQVPDTTPPGPPEIHMSVAGNQQVTLYWRANPEPDLEAYRIYRSEEFLGFTLLDAVTGHPPDTTYTDPGVVNGTIYYYRVTAVDTAGNESVPSAWQAVRPLPPHDGFRWYVAIQGNDTLNNGSSAYPYRNISRCLAEIDPGLPYDTVFVSGGDYIDNLTMPRRVHILGGRDSLTWEADWEHQPTVIDGGGGTIISASRNAGVVEGIRFRNGNRAFYRGSFPALWDAVIRHCEFTELETAIDVWGLGYMLVDSCRFHDIAGSAILLGQPARFLVKNSVFYNIEGTGGSQAAIFGYNWVNRGDVQNNVFYNVPIATRMTGNGSTTQYIRNNIFLNCFVPVDQPAGSSQNPVVAYNLTWNSGTISIDSLDIGNLNADPAFEDTAAGDFHLRVGSPAIDKGDPDLNRNGISWVTDPDDQDPDHTRLDMGAFYFDKSGDQSFDPPEFTLLPGEASIILEWLPDPRLQRVDIYKGLDSSSVSYLGTVISPQTTYQDTAVVNNQLYTYQIVVIDTAGITSGYSRSKHCSPTRVPGGLAAYYSFNGHVRDGSGNGNDGSGMGCVLTADRFGNDGQAYYFDGIDDFIALDSLVNLSNASEYVLSAWIRPEGIAGNWMTIYSESSPAAEVPQLQFRVNGEGGLQVVYQDDNGQQFLYSSGDTVAFGDWHHVIVEKQVDSMAFFIDRILAGRSPFQNPDPLTPIVSRIGVLDYFNGLDDPFQGDLDDVRLYRRLLTREEIRSLFTENAWDPGPRTPTGIAVTPGHRSNRLVWEPNPEPDIAGYRIYRGSSPAEISLLDSIPHNPTAIVYTDYGLNNGISYYYRVAAVDSSGQESAVSNPVAGVPTNAGINGELIVTGTVVQQGHLAALVNGQVRGQNFIDVDAGQLFEPGDEIMIITMQADIPAVNHNPTGYYEVHYVQDVSNNRLHLVTPLERDFTLERGQKHQVARIPNYSRLVIQSGGVLTTLPWNGSTGGILCFKARDSLVIHSGGRIEVTGLGYRGGLAVDQGGFFSGFSGESLRPSRQYFDRRNNLGGGGAGYGSCSEASGAGGYGSPGGTPTGHPCSGNHVNHGEPGDSYGLPVLNRLFLGSGGGGGGRDDNGCNFSDGYSGGGIVYIAAPSISISGSLLNNGHPAFSDHLSGCSDALGGAGAGGSIRLIADTISVSGTIAANGGEPVFIEQNGIVSGQGGTGRIRIDHRSATIAGSIHPQPLLVQESPQPRLWVSADTLRFRTLMGVPDSLQLVLTNLGLDTLSMAEMVLTGAGFSAGGSSLVLGHDDYHELTLVFLPDNGGVHQGTLLIQSNDPLRPTKSIVVIGEVYTPLLGSLTQDTTLTPDLSPYLVTGNVYVGNNAGLTIEPGVEILFQENAALDIGSDGRIYAVGSENDSILFTALDKQHYRNRWRLNVNSLLPGNEIAYGIFMGAGEHALGTFVDSDTNITIRDSRFTGNRLAIDCNSSSPVITGNVFTGNEECIRIPWDSNPLIHNNRFIQNSVSVNIYDFAGPVIRENTFEEHNAIHISAYARPAINANNLYCRVNNNTPMDIDARNNYWGLNVTQEIQTGANPKNISAIHDYFDDPNLGLVDYSHWLDAPWPAGNPVHANAYSGVLTFTGNSYQEAVPTYQRDDSLFISLQDYDRNSDDGSMETVTVHIWSEQETDTETLTLLESGISTGIFQGYITLEETPVAQPQDGVLQVLSGDWIGARYLDPLNTWLAADTIQAHIIFGLQLVEGGDINRDTTWTAELSPYLVQGDVRVVNDRTLTIEPGVRVYFQVREDKQRTGWNPGLCEIQVHNGRLTAVGTESDSIYFQSYSRHPQAGEWGSIGFWGNPTGSGTIRYAHLEGGEYGAVRIQGNAPRVEHSLFRNNQVAIHSWNGQVSNPIIRYCRILNSRNAGLHFESGGVIADCEIADNDHSGILLSGSFLVDILSNDIHHNGHNGIAFGWGGYASETGQISWNDIHHNYHCGIEINVEGEFQFHENNLFANSYQALLNNTTRPVDAQTCYWGTAATGLMNLGDNPKNIPVIYDAFDEDWRGLVNYAHWLNAAWPEGIPAAGGKTGVLSFTGPAGEVVWHYEDGDTMFIRVADPDRNADSTGHDVIISQVSSPLETGGETVILQETQADNGLFTGWIVLDQNTGYPVADQILQVDYNNHLSASYVDSSDDWGNVLGIQNTIQYLRSVDEFVADQHTILLLHFNENEGQLVHDESGYANDGIMGNDLAPDGADPEWQAAGVAGSCLYFPGSGSFVRIPFDSSLNGFADQLTVEMWVRFLSSSPNDWFLGRAGQTTGRSLGLYLTDRLEINTLLSINNIEYERGMTGGSALNLERWYKLALTYDGSALRFYVDDILTGEVNAAGQLTFTGEHDLFLGANSGGGENTEMHMDELRISDIVRPVASQDVNIPPGRITSLTVDSVSLNEINLGWYAPGSDRYTGTCAAYDLRMAEGPIDSGTFYDAIQVPVPFSPAVAGSFESLTVGNLTPASTYYFAIKATDDEGLESPLSNPASGTTDQALATLQVADIEHHADIPIHLVLDGLSAATVNLLFEYSIAAGVWSPASLVPDTAAAPTSHSRLPVRSKPAGTKVNRVKPARFLSGEIKALQGSSRQPLQHRAPRPDPEKLAGSSFTFNTRSDISDSVHFNWLSHQDLPGVDVNTVFLRVTVTYGNVTCADTTGALHIDNDQTQAITIQGPTGEVGGLVNVYFMAVDSTADTLSIVAGYSVDHGQSWINPLLEGNLTGYANWGVLDSLRWSSEEDLPHQDLDTVFFALNVSDGWGLGTGDTIVWHLDNNQPPVAQIMNLAAEYHLEVPITVEFSDEEADPVASVLYYSLDGLVWSVATLAPRSIPVLRRVPRQGLQAGPFPVRRTTPTASAMRMEIREDGIDTLMFIWDTWTDLGTGDFQTVFLRICPVDADTGLCATTPQFVVDNDAGYVILPPDSLFGLQSRTVAIPFTLVDPALDLMTVAGEYSLDQGLTWNPAALIEAGTALPAGVEDTLHWQSELDLPSIQNLSVWLRVLPHDGWEFGTSDTVQFNLVNSRAPAVRLLGILPQEYHAEVGFTLMTQDYANDSLTITFWYTLDGYRWESAAVTRSGGTQISGKMLTAGRPRSLARLPLPATAPGSRDVKSVHISDPQPEEYAAYVWHTVEDIGYRDTPARLKVQVADAINTVSDSSRFFRVDNHVGRIAFDMGDLQPEYSGLIPLRYTITDSTGDTYEVAVHYSPDAGQTWSVPALSGTMTAIGPGAYQDTLLWSSAVDLVNVDAVILVSLSLRDNWQSGPGDTLPLHIDNQHPPQLQAVNLPEDLPIHWFDHFQLTFSRDIDPVSLDDGIQVRHLAGVDTGLTVAYDTQERLLRIVPDVAWISGDSIRVSITTGLRDLLGNPFDGNGNGDPDGNDDQIDLSYRVGWLGDYDLSYTLDINDLDAFRLAWWDQAPVPQLETGPVSGDLPFFQIQPDSVIDFEDLMVFTRMWNWMAGLGPSGAPIPARTPASGNRRTSLIAQYANSGEPRSLEISLRVDSLNVVGSAEFILTFDPEYLAFLALESNLDKHWLHLSYFDSTRSTIRIDCADLNQVVRQSPEYPFRLRFAVRSHGVTDILLLSELRNRAGIPVELSRASFDFSTLPPLPVKYALHQNYPNPFNPHTQIRYDLPEDTRVRMVIYNLRGQQVVVLKESWEPAGFNTVQWDGSNQYGKPAGSGIYFVVLKTAAYTASKKMVLLR